MGKLFVVFVFLLMGSNALAAENDFRCLRSVDSKNSIKLQFVFDSEKDGFGSVVYQKGDKPIPVKRMTEKELKRGPSGRPSEVEAQWQETTPDGSGGTYVIVSQGALISKFQYIRKKDGKVFVFEEDMDATGENGCAWNTK